MPLRLQLHSISQRIEVRDLTRCPLQGELLPGFHLLKEYETGDPKVRLLLQFGHELKGPTLVSKVEAKEIYWMIITSEAP